MYLLPQAKNSISPLELGHVGCAHEPMDAAKLGWSEKLPCFRWVTPCSATSKSPSSGRSSRSASDTCSAISLNSSIASIGAQNLPVMWTGRPVSSLGPRPDLTKHSSSQMGLGNQARMCRAARAGYHRSCTQIDLRPSYASAVLFWGLVPIGLSSHYKLNGDQNGSIATIGFLIWTALDCPSNLRPRPSATATQMPAI
jgi:hypothetical protein